MAAVALFMAIALLCRASADNISTSFLLPDLLFYPSASLQTFVGQMTVTDSTTYYTLNCGSDETNFFPGGYSRCDANNSYTFSADSTNTQYLLPNQNLGSGPLPNTSPIPTWLENFNQTITLNCGPLNTASWAHCGTTSLLNIENPEDSSTISPTIVTESTTVHESSLYPIFFTAAAAATPLNSVASSTTANPTPPTSRPPTSNPTSHSALSSGSKAGIGIGVPVGVFALAGIALLLYRHRKHKERSRLSQIENLVPPGSFSDMSEGKNAPDNGGVYEMQGRQSPAHPMEMEG